MSLHEEVPATRRERVVPAERERVWELVAEPDGLAGWLADEVDLERVEPGARGWVRDGDEERLVTVEDVEPGRRVALTWCAPGGTPSVVDITLDDAESGTRVTVVEIPLHVVRALPREVEAALPHGPMACV